MTKKYSFKLLQETSLEGDAFDVGAHKRVANSILNLLYSDNEPINIALEGPWGSGKSTIINLLKTEIEQKNDEKDQSVKQLKVFYFDAWAHEGDPLRRVFLESFISSTKDTQNEQQLDKIIQRLGGKTKRVTTERTPTEFGVWFSISALLVPIGLGLISTVENGKLVYTGGQPYWSFIIGLILTCAPLVYLFCKWIQLLILKYVCKKLESNIWSPKNWSFISSTATSNNTTEVSEEEERTSLEFEKFFNEALKCVLSNNKQFLVLIIDNLDRTEREDALRIWSTLQTFLQHRNTGSGTNDKHKRIWTIVPYDPKGIRHLWNKEIAVNKGDDDSVKKEESVNQHRDKPSHHSFLEKSFQLKIDVPIALRTTWEKFARIKMEESFAKWPSEEIDIALRTLQLSLRTLDYSPTPREIKSFINQVGYLREYSDNSIGVSSIVYYLFQRQFNCETNEKLIQSLLSSEFPEERDRNFLSPNISNEICGIIFNVSADKGRTLLLKDPIEKALFENNKEEIDNLLVNHTDGFWSILTLIISENEPEYMAKFAKGLEYTYQSCENNRSTEIQSVFDKLGEYLSKPSASFTFPTDKKHADNFNAIFRMARSNETPQYIWTALSEVFQNQYGGEQAFKPEPFDCLIYIYQSNCQQRKLTPIEAKKITIPTWEQIAVTTFEKKTPLYDVLKPTQDHLKDLFNIFETNKIAEIPKTVKRLKYSLFANINADWEQLTETITKVVNSSFRINANSNNGAIIQAFRDIPEILHLISLKGSRHQSQTIKKLLENESFYLMISQLNTPEVYCYTLILTHYYNIQPSSNRTYQINYKQNVLTQKDRFLNQGKETEAQILFEIAEKTGDYNFIYDLARKNNDLETIKSFFLIAQETPNTRVYKGRDFGNMITVIDTLMKTLIPDEDQQLKNTAIRFVNESNVFFSFLESHYDLTVPDTAASFYYLLYAIHPDCKGQLVKLFKENIKGASEEIWFNDINNRGYLLLISLYIRQNLASNSVIGTNAYLNALQKYISTNSDFVAHWHREDWTTILTLLGKKHLKEFKGWVKSLDEGLFQKSEVFETTFRMLETE